MDPPGQGSPVGASFVTSGKPGNDNAGGRAHAAFGIPAVPYVGRKVLFIARAVQLVYVTEFVDLWRAIGGSNGYPAEGVLQRLQQLLAKLAPHLDCKIRIIGNVGNAVEVFTLALAKLPLLSSWDEDALRIEFTEMVALDLDYEIED